MGALESFSRVADDLVGMKVSHLWRGYGSTIFLEFGALAPGKVRRDGSAGNPVGEIMLSVEWSWRIEDETSIICGSWSEDDVWERSFNRLRDAAVSRLSMVGRLPEIDLELTSGHHFVSFMTADGQPEWSLVDRRSTPHTWLSVRDGLLFEDDGTAPGT